MTDMRGPDGVRGINIETPSGGVKKLDADRTGRIKVEDKQLVNKLKSEGFDVAGVAIGGFSRGYQCKCGLIRCLRFAESVVQ